MTPRKSRRGATGPSVVAFGVLALLMFIAVGAANVALSTVAVTAIWAVTMSAWARTTGRM